MLVPLASAPRAIAPLAIARLAIASIGFAVIAGGCASNSTVSSTSGAGGSSAGGSSSSGTGASSAAGGSTGTGAGGTVTTGDGGSTSTGLGGNIVTGDGGSSATGAGGATSAGQGGSTGAGGTTPTGLGGSGATGAGGGAGGSTGPGGSPGSGGGAGAGVGGSTGGGTGTGTGGGGGATGVGGAGAFGLGGPSRCATAGVALCESFENGLSASIWTTHQSGDGTAVVDGLQAARGTKALHVKTTAGNGFAYITEKMTFPAPSNVLYARMFVYLGDPFTTNGHFSFAEGDGTGSKDVARFGGQNKVLGVGSDGGPSGDWTDKDNKTIPALTWMCLELELDGTTNEFHVFWDDVERTALNRGPAQHPAYVMPQFNSLWFGYWMYNMTEPQELWIDEIAVDYKPIGCVK